MSRTSRNLELRPARDSDSAALIDLIARCFAEYPGCVLDVDREEPELRHPATAFEAFWVLTQDGAVRGCASCGTRSDADGTRWLEIKKVYLDARLRGMGQGRRLIETVEQHARALGIDHIDLWSDTRFETAHAVYEKLGYSRTGEIRELGDLSNTTEYRFEKHSRRERPLKDRG